jgi:hypothetical protein
MVGEGLTDISLKNNSAEASISTSESMNSKVTNKLSNYRLN